MSRNEPDDHRPESWWPIIFIAAVAFGMGGVVVWHFLSLRSR